MRLPLRFLLVCLVLSSGGCVTGRVWDWARQPKWATPRIVATLHDAPDAPPNALVLNYYGDRKGEPLPAVVPLGADGRPLEPFHFGGAARHPLNVRDAIPDEQQRRVLAVRFDDAATVRDARRRIAAAHVVPTDSPGPGRLYWRANTFIATEGYAMIAYWRDANESGSDITGRFPASSQVLLVPESFPRSGVERALRSTAAAVATPFTAVVDVVIWIPVLVSIDAGGS